MKEGLFRVQASITFYVWASCETEAEEIAEDELVTGGVWEGEDVQIGAESVSAWENDPEMIPISRTCPGITLGKLREGDSESLLANLFPLSVTQQPPVRHRTPAGELAVSYGEGLVVIYHLQRASEENPVWSGQAELVGLPTTTSEDFDFGLLDEIIQVLLRHFPKSSPQETSQRTLAMEGGAVLEVRGGRFWTIYLASEKPGYEEHDR